jgi:hypothetical protein
VKSAITQLISGLKVENLKFDFKLLWYILNEQKGKSEFIKDSSAIANTFGPDGFIVIGYDDRKKAFSGAGFDNSGIPDSSGLP